MPSKRQSIHSYIKGIKPFWRIRCTGLSLGKGSSVYFTLSFLKDATPLLWKWGRQVEEWNEQGGETEALKQRWRSKRSPDDHVLSTPSLPTISASLANKGMSIFPGWMSCPFPSGVNCQGPHDHQMGTSNNGLLPPQDVFFHKLPSVQHQNPLKSTLLAPIPKWPLVRSINTDAL